MIYYSSGPTVTHRNPYTTQTLRESCFLQMAHGLAHPTRTWDVEWQAAYSGNGEALWQAGAHARRMGDWASPRSACMAFAAIVQLAVS